MPVYTVINKTTKEHTEVFCSWSDLQEMLKDDNQTIIGYFSNYISNILRV